MLRNRYGKKPELWYNVPVKNCIFCDAASGTISVRKIYEDGEMLAFKDMNPAAPAHCLLIPKKHIGSLLEMEEEDCALAGRMLYRAKELAKEMGLESGGARFVINAGEDAGQSVGHLHIHVLGGRPFGWPPG